MTPLPTGWTSARLADLLDVLIDHRGRTPGKLGSTFVDAGVPVISAIHIKDGRVDFAQRHRYVTREIAERWMPEPLRASDVLLTSEAPLGSVAQVPTDEPLVLSQRLFALRGRPDVLLNRYLFWALQAPQVTHQLHERSSGSTVTGIRQAELRRVELPLPPLGEQRRIVDLLDDHLSRLDAAHDYLASALRRAERLATTQIWQLTHALEGASTRLDQVAEVRLGRQRSPANHHGERMRPYLRAANVDWNRLRLDDVKEMNFTEAEERTYRLEPGDILVVEASGSAAEAGKSALYESTPAAVCFQNTLLRVRCTPAAEPRFVQKYLLAEAMAGRFIEDARGVGINHIGRAKLASLKVTLPALEVQRSTASSCDRALEAVEMLSSTLKESTRRGAGLRRALLDAAFSGRLTGSSSDLNLAEERIDAAASESSSSEAMENQGVASG